MLKAIVNFLNLKLELLNYFDLTRCLCELKTKGDVIAPKEYVSGGEWQNIDFDSRDGVSYWRLRDPISVSREANPNKALKRVQTTVPMKLVFSVRRDKLTTDDAYSFDRIRQTVVKQFNIDNGALTTALGAAKVTITAPSSDGDPLSVWDAETSGTDTQEPDFKFVFGSIDIDIVIDSDTECLPTECDDVDSDILHTFDFCDAAVRDRLTAAQVTCLEDALCGAGLPVTEQINGVTIGTVASGGINNQVITDSAAAPVGTEANPSVIGDATVTVNGDSLGATGSVVAEGSVDLVVNLDGSPSGSWDGDSWEVTSAVCADATVNVNGVFMENIPSGDTENIEVRQETGATLVGSKQGQYWRVDDATVENSDASYSATVAAEGSLALPNITVTDSDGSTSSVPSVQDVTCTPSTPPPTLTIGVYSDSGLTNPITSADFEDTIYINIATVGLTPTNHRFLIFNTSDSGVRYVQAGATIAYTITSPNNLIIYAESENGSLVAAALTAFEVSINSDVDASAFITAHNILSGSTMGSVQFNALQTFYRMMKGFNTPNGSNLLAYQKANANTRLYILVPVDDSTANLNAYALDALHLGIGTYNGFIGADATPNGVIGGSGKYFDMGVAPDELPLTDISYGSYSRSDVNATQADIGSSFTTVYDRALLTFPRASSGSVFYVVNDSSNTNKSVPDSLGLLVANRTGTLKSIYKDGALLDSQTRLTTGQSPNNTYAHATNQGGSANYNSSRQLTCYFQMLGMTANQIQDFNTAITYLQTNIITGGRNV